MRVQDVDFSPGGTYLAVGGFRLPQAKPEPQKPPEVPGVVWLWETATGRVLLHEENLQQGVDRLQFTAQGDRLFAIMRSRHGYMQSALVQQEQGDIPGGQILAKARRHDTGFCAWDLGATGAKQVATHFVNPTQPGAFVQLLVQTDGTQCIHYFGSPFRPHLIQEVATGKMLGRLQGMCKIQALEIDPETKHFVGAAFNFFSFGAGAGRDYPQMLMFWDQAGTVVRTVPLDMATVHDFLYTPGWQTNFPGRGGCHDPDAPRSVRPCHPRVAWP
jgi:hypothetical protein